MTTLRRVASLSGPARYDLTYLAAVGSSKGAKTAPLPASWPICRQPPSWLIQLSRPLPASTRAVIRLRTMVRIGNTRKEGR